MFVTQYNFKNNINSVAGSYTIDVSEVEKTGEKKVDIGYDYTYKECFDAKGKRHLVISGRDNKYAKIQTFKDDVDIYKIVARYTNGDISVLDKNKGFYADVSNMPKSFNEFHNKIVEGQNIFNGLPIDFKDEFGHSINEFMQSIYDKSFESRYQNYVSRKNARFSGIISTSADSMLASGVEKGDIDGK